MTHSHPAAPVSPRRDVAIDAIRGLAVFTMVAANLAAGILAKPHPHAFRFYGSFAAPTFVVLAGMMVARTASTRGYGFLHFLQRGITILAIAAALEVAIWQVIPFTAVDVLYLLGISLPLAYLTLRLPRWAGWLLAAGIFLASQPLRHVFGYTDYPTTITLAGDLYVTPQHPTSIGQHWLLDGWFPILPWLGFALFGAQLEFVRSGHGRDSATWLRSATWSGLAMTAAGWIWWRLVPDGMLTRGDYSEVFYPATLPFLVTAIGIVLILFAVVDRCSDLAIWRPFRLLGEAALAIYLLHFILIRFIFAEAFEDGSIRTFAVLYAITIAALLVAAFAIRLLKARWPTARSR
ncbi:MAG: heparan-alpha-glucosaminide N-acetyltransferase domain-containing protein [Gemmataceae bacterium]